MEKIKSILAYLEDNDLYPDFRVVNGAVNTTSNVDGEDVIVFSSNSYLGLSTNPKVIEASINAIKKYGVGSTGSRMLSGNLKIHRDFEKAIANFKGGEDAIVWPSGYSANVGIITAIMNLPKIGPSDLFARKNVILSDELNHASIIDGCKMSGQEKIIYNHCDVVDLEKKLKKYKNRRKLVVTDSVFSMDGDIAPLDKIVLLCRKYNAILMIDEAHATGVLGKTGRGACEYFNLKPGKDVDIVMGTCSKALGSNGGFVVGDKYLIDFLRIASRSYIFSTAMAPATSAALIATLKIISDNPERVKKLQDNANYLRKGLNDLGFNTITSQTQIIPVLIGEEKKAIEFAKKLFEEKIFAPCVRWPAVEKNKAIIRFTITSEHNMDQINYLLKKMKLIGKELNLI